MENKTNLWHVKCTHPNEGGWFQETAYSIYDEDGNLITSYYKKDYLEQICLAHNKCFGGSEDGLQ